MDGYGNDDKADPDYVSHNIALKRAEKLKEDNVNSVQKFKEIVDEEFNKELSHRQNQIEHIEQQIYKTQKLLHLLRYVLISSYYNRKELEYNGSEDVVSKAETSYLFDQNRIHPALKKLLGKNTSAPDFAMCRTARRSKAGHKSNLMVENLNDTSFRNSVSISNKSVSNNSADGNNLHVSSGVDRNRQKIKNRIIVGNISKWMPSYEDDNLTHKWMMYVRGPKENPDVSHFIAKVMFYLHPSYKPHDVIEVSEPPFHLSRRGWGEFPIRVQIHFRCTLNKPVDIVHNLKLDKTYSGRQTLGNESIIDLYLYDDKITDIMEVDEEVDLKENYGNIEKKDEKKKHEIVAFTDICEKIETKEAISTQLDQESVSNFEHDYCSEDVKPNINNIDIKRCNEPLSLEHSYSSPSSHEYLNFETKNSRQEYIEQEENSLIYGLDESYSETAEQSTKKEPLYYRKALVYTTKQPINNKNQHISPQSRGKIIAAKGRTRESLLKKMFTTKISSQLAPAASISSNVEVKPDDVHENLNVMKTIDGNEFRMSLSQTKLPKFKNIGEALNCLFKRFPLISELAENPNYKSSYPFTSSSINEFDSWNIAKQSSAEWSRAKVIKKILAREDIHEYQKWNTKALMMYGRSHGYTPRANLSLFEKNSVENKLINSCFKSSVDLPFTPNKYSVELSVDVENESDMPDEKRMKLSTIDVSDSALKMPCTYVREEALECGVVLKNEYIDENIVFNGGERMIFEAVKCLADHLVRRSLHYAISDGSYGIHNGEISAVHVQKAKEDRREFDSLSQFKIRQSKMKYFYH